MRSEICYEDEQVIVAYKPAGLATQSSRIGQIDMVSELKKHLSAKERGKEPYLGLIHRLDQPVEGLLVFAKTKESAAALSKELTKKTLNKSYKAVLCGCPEKKEGTLTDYLIKNKDNVAEIVDEKNPEAKRAVLQYQILKEKGDFALASITIETGRFHQIRVQMSHLGVPLLGDLKYGGEGMREKSMSLSVTNVGLCADEIVFTHPKTKKHMKFSIEPKGKAFAVFEE